MKHFISILIFIIAENSFACSVPKPGQTLGVTDLVESSQLIVVAELVSSEKLEFWTLNVLKVVEFIKGDSEDEVSFTTYNDTAHDSDTYLNHMAPWFWLPMVGRSEFPSGICGPDFTFRKGEKYLLFLDNFGSYKSAEIVNESDAWYRYVKSKAQSL